MIDLPKCCLVDRFIPKKKFYENIGINSSTKDDFINKVDRITWLYKLSEDNTGINKTDKVEEIQIFEIEVKVKEIPKNIIKVISKAVKYKILFVIKYDNDICYCVNLEDLYFTDWNEEVNFNFEGINLENIFQNIVKLIIKEENNNDEFDKVIEDKNRKIELENRIKILKNKINKEKQFNRKVELNLELKKLEKEMDE